MTASQPLQMWTVYDHPRDHPDAFVARLWLATPGEPTKTDVVVQSRTLHGLHALLPPGLYCLPRQEGDDPAILETWI